MHIAPWVLKSWRPVLWQTDRPSPDRFAHRGTRVTFTGDSRVRMAGQTMWAGETDDGEAGLAWDWVQTSRGVVAMADPMGVITNLRLIGSEGEVLTSLRASIYLNALVHELPWQGEVERALRNAMN